MEAWISVSKENLGKHRKDSIELWCEIHTVIHKMNENGCNLWLLDLFLRGFHTYLRDSICGSTKMYSVPLQLILNFFAFPPWNLTCYVEQNLCLASFGKGFSMCFVRLILKKYFKRTGDKQILFNQADAPGNTVRYKG